MGFLSRSGPLLVGQTDGTSHLQESRFRILLLAKQDPLLDLPKASFDPAQTSYQDVAGRRGPNCIELLRSLWDLLSHSFPQRRLAGCALSVRWPTTALPAVFSSEAGHRDGLQCRIGGRSCFVVKPLIPTIVINRLIISVFQWNCFPASRFKGASHHDATILSVN
jgi:hypothetical protein